MNNVPERNYIIIKTIKKQREKCTVKRYALEKKERKLKT